MGLCFLVYIMKRAVFFFQSQLFFELQSFYQGLHNNSSQTQNHLALFGLVSQPPCTWYPKQIQHWLYHKVGSLPDCELHEHRDLRHPQNLEKCLGHGRYLPNNQRRKEQRKKGKGKGKGRRFKLKSMDFVTIFNAVLCLFSSCLAQWCKCSHTE